MGMTSCSRMGVPEDYYRYFAVYRREDCLYSTAFRKRSVIFNVDGNHGARSMIYTLCGGMCLYTCVDLSRE